MTHIWTILTNFQTFFWNISFLLAGLAGLGILIGFHELGHFLFCKLFKVRTPSFSIGFGPKIFSKKFGETEFVLSAIPVGGFVEIAGSAEIGQGEQTQALAQDEHSFAIKPYYQKLLIMLGGIIFNMLFAYASLIFIFYAGIPKNALLETFLTTKPTIVKIEPNSVAQKAGLQPQDVIKKASTPENSITIEDSNQMPSLKEFLMKSRNKTIDLEISRNGETHSITMNPEKETVTSFGIYFETEQLPEKMGLLKSIKYGIWLTNEIIYKTITAFKSLFTKREFGSLAGPVMIISMVKTGASQGFGIFLFLLAIISINLAILNLIPLPILDGGQILFYTIEAIIGRQLPFKVKYAIHLVSWIAILLLIAYLTIHDFFRIFQPFFTTLKTMFGY